MSGKCLAAAAYSLFISAPVRRKQIMSANTAFHIAVLPGDGIGHEVMAPTLVYCGALKRHAEPEIPLLGNAGRRRALQGDRQVDAGKHRQSCEEADAILLGACGLPSVRYPDNTEITPQVTLRFIFDLYAGVRPAQLVPGVPSPIVGAPEARHRFRADPRVDRRPVRLMAKASPPRRKRARRWSSRAIKPSGCSISRLSWPNGARSAASPAA